MAPYATAPHDPGCPGHLKVWSDPTAGAEVECSSCSWAINIEQKTITEVVLACGASPVAAEPDVADEEAARWRAAADALEAHARKWREYAEAVEARG